MWSVLTQLAVTLEITEEVTDEFGKLEGDHYL